MLLIETAAAVTRLREILAVPGVEEIMIGLNDLSLSLELDNPFEVVTSDLMSAVAEWVLGAGVRFGFGGLARIDDGTLPVPPDLVAAQYPRLGVVSAWLSRSFFRGIASPEVPGAVRDLRARIAYWRDSRSRYGNSAGGNWRRRSAAWQSPKNEAAAAVQLPAPPGP